MTPAVAGTHRVATMSAVEIVRSIVVDRHIDDVFRFVADPRDDPRWCPKVLSVEQIEGNGPGPGARYEVLHRPVPLRPLRRMVHTCVAWEPPGLIAWREEDGTDALDVTYTLEAVWTATRMTQRTAGELGAPAALRPFVRHGIGRDVARQQRALKLLLERGA
jgi:hypothetical protein